MAARAHSRRRPLARPAAAFPHAHVCGACTSTAWASARPRRRRQRRGKATCARSRDDCGSVQLSVELLVVHGSNHAATSSCLACASCACVVMLVVVEQELNTNNDAVSLRSASSTLRLPLQSRHMTNYIAHPRRGQALRQEGRPAHDAATPPSSPPSSRRRADGGTPSSRSAALVSRKYDFTMSGWHRPVLTAFSAFPHELR